MYKQQNNEGNIIMNFYSLRDTCISFYKAFDGSEDCKRDLAETYGFSLNEMDDLIQAGQLMSENDKE